MWFTQGVGLPTVLKGDFRFDVEGKSASRECVRDLALLASGQVVAFEHRLDRASHSWDSIAGTGHCIRAVAVVECCSVLDGVVPMFVPLSRADPD